jgi:hypothetical protein
MKFSSEGFSIFNRVLKKSIGPSAKADISLRLEAQKNQPPSARLPASSLQLPADCM